VRLDQGDQPMNEFIDFITSNNTIAYITAFIIFIITLVLVVRRLIGFMITLLLLIFAILSGLSIANHDLFREMLQSFKTTNAPQTTEDKSTYYKNQFMKAFDELKKEFEELKVKWEAMYESYKSTSKEKKDEQQNRIEHDESHRS